MKKKLLIGLGLSSLVIASVGYIVSKPYFDEKARIEHLADELEDRTWTTIDDNKNWYYSYYFEIPNNQKPSDWNVENLKLPQLLFSVESSEDSSKVSYWSLNIDGTSPQLLINEGVLPAPPISNTIDYAQYMSRSPNGRYLIIPQKDTTLLYDLSNDEMIAISEIHGGMRHDIMWDIESTQVVIKKQYELIRVKLDTKEIIKLSDVYGEFSEYITYQAKAYMSQQDQSIYFSLDDRTAYFGCGGEDQFTEAFSESDAPECGNTLVFDAKTLKLIDRGDFSPSRFDCNLWGGRYGDGFYCLRSDNGAVYSLGKPLKIAGEFYDTANLLAFNGGDMWFVPVRGRSISRVLSMPTPTSPIIKMTYVYGAKEFKTSTYGFGFSRYVIENKDIESWSDSLNSLPTYTDLEKAKAVLRSRKDG